MRRFTLVLNGLVAATLCGVSVVGAADLSPAPRHYVKAQETRQYPWALACPTRQCWVWHEYAWDPEYNNEIGHYRGVPPPPPPPPPAPKAAPPPVKKPPPPLLAKKDEKIASLTANRDRMEEETAAAVAQTAAAVAQAAAAEETIAALRRKLAEVTGGTSDYLDGDR